MSKFRKKPILIFVIALIALYIIIYIIPKVTGALVSSYTVEYGELKVADETQKDIWSETSRFTSQRQAVRQIVTSRAEP